MIFRLQDAQTTFEEADFATRFEFEQAKARMLRGDTDSPYSNPFGGSVSSNISEDTKEIVTTNLQGLDAIREVLYEIKMLNIDQRRFVKKSWELYKNWDAVGLPPTRT